MSPAYHVPTPEGSSSQTPPSSWSCSCSGCKCSLAVDVIQVVFNCLLVGCPFFFFFFSPKAVLASPLLRGALPAICQRGLQRTFSRASSKSQLLIQRAAPAVKALRGVWQLRNNPGPHATIPPWRYFTQTGVAGDMGGPWGCCGGVRAVRGLWRWGWQP